MTSTITREAVLDNLDGAMVEDVEEIEEPGTVFNVAATIGGMGIHIVREREDGPLLVVGAMALDGEHLEIFRELSDAQRMNFLSQIGAVLTNSPGLYRFTDGGGNDVPYDDLEAVRIEHRIYPDGFGEHTLMNGLFDVVQALYYVKTMTNVFMSNLQNRL